MEIMLVPINGGSRFEFPSLPAEVSVKNGSRYRSYSIIGLGNVKIPKGTDVESISWSSYFYGPSKRGEPMMGEYMDPKACVRILERFRDNGEPLRIMCSEIGINRDVTISSFTWTPYGAHGNVKYSIEFAQWKELKVRVTKNAVTTAAPNAAADTPEPRPEPAPAATYEVQARDTLCKIARNKCGGESNWVKLYETNSAVIEATAKNHGLKDSDKGHWIYPGTVLTLPT